MKKIRDFEEFVVRNREYKEEYGGIEDARFCLEYVERWRGYIYGRGNISMRSRGIMWEYLNGDIGEEELWEYFYTFYERHPERYKE